MSRRLIVLLLCLCPITTTAGAQWVDSIKVKTLEPIKPAGRMVQLAIPPEETPGYQRFRVATSETNREWTIDIATPDGTSFQVDANSIVNYVAYDDVVEFAVSTPGKMSFTGSASAPFLLHVSAVVRERSLVDRYPIGDFNLEPAAAWPPAYRTAIEPALVVLRSSGKAAPSNCNATQISPGLFLTAHHCIRNVVDDDCRPLASGIVQVLVEPRPISVYGLPITQAMASAVAATPVFCGNSSADRTVPSAMDYAIVTTAVQIRNGAALPPTGAVLPSGTKLLLSAYLSQSASGVQDKGMAQYSPDLYLSRDTDCRIPPSPIDDGCPAGHIVHHCDTWPTMSGGALFRRSDAALIGVHHFGANYANCALPWMTILADMRANATTPQRKAVVARFP